MCSVKSFKQVSSQQGGRAYDVGVAFNLILRDVLIRIMIHMIQYMIQVHSTMVQL